MYNDKNFRKQISCQNEIEFEKIAKKLLDGEINVYDLEDNLVEKMEKYFINDIQKQEKELEKIKKHILEMKEKLQNKI